MAFRPQEFGSWYPDLKPWEGETWYQILREKVESAYAQESPRVFPPREDLFRALRHTPPAAVRCVILGQDPYPGYGQANGLSFSVRRGVPIPRSLKNIYRELEDDLGIAAPDHGCLDAWAERGVLLLNSALTVFEGRPNSHQNWGWEEFTSRILEIAERQSQPVAYLLWGKAAQAKAGALLQGDNKNPRLVLTSSHPSPLSANRGFFGSRPFSRVNAFLAANGENPIDWSLA